MAFRNLLLVLLCSGVQAFYVPGVHPATFKRGSEVPLKVNSLSSTHTQVPRDYYRLPFCEPEQGIKMASESLGEFPGPQSRQALEELLVESSYNSYVRRKAAQALRKSLPPAEFCPIIKGIIDREADPIFQVFLDNMLTDACR